MKTIMVLAFFLTGIFALQAQQLTTPADGGNKKASVSERIGVTDITINYDRPGVKGREGKIWGQLVHTGFADLDFGTSHSAPWRAGANECTTIKFSTDVMIEGRPLPAGKYGFFIAYDPNECTLIFSKNNSAWGSYFYNEKDDALRVKVKPVALDKSVEWLSYDFMNEKEFSSTIALSWEKLQIPFKIEVDYIKTQLDVFRKELQTDIGFDWRPWRQAAKFCADINTNLEEGLQWSEYSVSGRYIGEKNFQTLSTKAEILSRLNRTAEADATMKEALSVGGINQLNNYALQLLDQKRSKEAFDVFKMNYDKNPNKFITNMGLAKGYSATGNYKEALKYAQAALAQAPDEDSKNTVTDAIAKLKAGKDMN